ncbi:hypothetical protein N2603_35915 [Bradyrhizobium huanghuaihaiense]|uniref:hypothetical protein n=1 Tax=Bradyrhizobium huanghuaihaiense TaxID=990078 RepID=UPI0021A982F1|nr:hypothetical protein [Bradyrhizobium sp. CB3035]UWU75384.1 hypothetical protein N2603_35915 [Bradyrhizobium sp. CB3035]
MNALHTWLSQQHHGLQTFREFQQRLYDACKNEPDQQGLCCLLNTVVDNYVEAFDEEPLPVAVADHAYQRLLDLVADIDFGASAEQRLVIINRVAASDLLH